MQTQEETSLENVFITLGYGIKETTKLVFWTQSFFRELQNHQQTFAYRLKLYLTLTYTDLIITDGRFTHNQISNYIAYN